MRPPDDILSLVAARKGHFLLESGHHGELWLDLELLYVRPRLVEPAAVELATRLAALGVDAVCGPLVEGAFVALMVASHLGVDFSYSERFAQPPEDGLFTAEYRIPGALTSRLRHKRVAIVNDVVNAGSAVRGTFAALADCGAAPVAIGALLVLGTAAFEFASSKGIALQSMAALPNSLWTPAECPLCVVGAPLADLGNFRSALAENATVSAARLPSVAASKG
jgi:orotate phosphoribosyltransferase